MSKWNIYISRIHSFLSKIFILYSAYYKVLAKWLTQMRPIILADAILMFVHRGVATLSIRGHGGQDQKKSCIQWYFL